MFGGRGGGVVRNRGAGGLPVDPGPQRRTGSRRLDPAAQRRRGCRSGDRQIPTSRWSRPIVLSGAEGSNAVVVDLHNDSDENLTEVPILVEVTDAKGKCFYKNDIPGHGAGAGRRPIHPRPRRRRMGQRPGVGRRQAEVGRGDGRRRRRHLSGALPEIEVSEPKLEGDPVSGISATGDGRQQDRRGPAPPAALRRRTQGRRSRRRRPRPRSNTSSRSTKKLSYTVFFIGDPSGRRGLKLSEFPDPDQAPNRKDATMAETDAHAGKRGRRCPPPLGPPGRTLRAVRRAARPPTSATASTAAGGAAARGSTTATTWPRGTPQAGEPATQPAGAEQPPGPEQPGRRSATTRRSPRSAASPCSG